MAGEGRRGQGGGKEIKKKKRQTQNPSKAGQVGQSHFCPQCAAAARMPAGAGCRQGCWGCAANKGPPSAAACLRDIRQRATPSLLNPPPACTLPAASPSAREARVGINKFPLPGREPSLRWERGGGGRKGRIKELFCCRGAWYTATVKPRELEAIVKKSLKSVSFHSVLRERFKFCAS